MVNFQRNSFSIIFEVFSSTSFSQHDLDQGERESPNVARRILSVKTAFSKIGLKAQESGQGQTPRGGASRRRV